MIESRWDLFQAPFAVGEVVQEAGVPQYLKLLADFIADVAVVGMEFFQFWGEGVDVFVGEVRFAEAMDDVEDV
jgi:hypothetical protein